MLTRHQSQHHGSMVEKEVTNSMTKKNTDPAALVRNMPATTMLYMPIERIDREKREIVARATSEALDSYNTVFSFEGSKEAFGKWRGNIREMHDPTKAVGKAVSWVPVDDTKAIDVTLQVSRGAEDTWLKVLDGTLSGLSVGAKNAQWGVKDLDGTQVPYLERYDLVEVSLVDNPANPDCNISVVRADGFTTDVVEESYDDEETTPEVVETDETRVDAPEEVRAGARLSADTMSQMHAVRDHALLAVRKACATCGCPECQALLSMLDPDNDGDVDVVADLDTDHDAARSTLIEKSVREEISRSLTPILSRFNGIASRLAQSQPFDTPEVTRRNGLIDDRLSQLDEVRSLLSEVKGQVEKIASQPLPGGPIVNSAAMRMQANTMTDADVVVRAQQLGLISDDKSTQMNAALALFKQDNGQRR